MSAEVSTGRFGIVILAAGASVRMGQPKQLLDFGGRPLLRHAVETAGESSVAEVVAVLGANAEKLRSAAGNARVVENPAWEGGMGTSIRAGIEEAVRLDLDGVILALADQPRITGAIYDRLLAAHRQTGAPIVSSRYAGTVGVPVFFARSHFSQLLALKPAQGCKGVILQHTAEALLLDCPEAEADIDTPEDYAALTGPIAASH